MSTAPSPTTTSHRALIFDLLVIVAISGVAQTTHFSFQQGRAVISGDSVQYIASAQALLDGDQTPHFEMRKPGYILFLAGVALLSGNMGWAAITCNHVLLALIPVAAYGFGLHLRGRSLAWLAAALVIARLQGVHYADRMMSEALYTCVLSFGLLALVTGLSRYDVYRWMTIAGILLGLAWFTRSAATPLIGAALLTIVIVMRADMRRAIAAGVALVIPIAGFALLECSLNRAYGHQFRPSNGTAGATILLRARNFEGLDWPQTEEAKRVISLVPQRSADSVYVANLLDAWVARYHAIYLMDMDEWEYDSLMRRVGVEILVRNFGDYAASSARMTLHHLLRQPDGQSLSPIAPDRLAEPLIHPAAMDTEEAKTYWFAYWGLPHLPLEESIARVEGMKIAAARKAPFGASAIWKALRYWKTKAPAAHVVKGMDYVATLWPGFALLGSYWLGLNRKTCLFLALAYILDAVFIGFLTPTTARIQFTWLMTDTTLAGALVVGGLALLAQARRWLPTSHRDASQVPVT